MSSLLGLIRSRMAQANAAARPKPGDRCLVNNVYRAPDWSQKIFTIHRSHTCSSSDRCDTCGATGMDLVQPCGKRTVVRIRFRRWFKRIKSAA